MDRCAESRSGDSPSSIPLAEGCEALVHDPHVRLARLDSTLNPEKDRAVLLKLIAVEVQLFDFRSIFVNEQAELIDGLHATIFAQSGCELVGTKLCEYRGSRYFGFKNGAPIMCRVDRC